MASDANNVRSLRSRLSAGRARIGEADIAAYASDLVQFSEFLEKRRVLLGGARRSDVREYIQELFSHSLDGRSVGRKLSAIRHLYRHLLLDGKIKKDQPEHRSAQAMESPAKALSRDEVEPCSVKQSCAKQSSAQRTRTMKPRADKRSPSAIAP